jgi:hypothetical protein
MLFVFLLAALAVLIFFLQLLSNLIIQRKADRLKKEERLSSPNKNSGPIPKDKWQQWALITLIDTHSLPV